jgi:tRNA A-37 threonylcarbamoyl transferase component Bud32
MLTRSKSKRSSSSIISSSSGETRKRPKSINQIKVSESGKWIPVSLLNQTIYIDSNCLKEHNIVSLSAPIACGKFGCTYLHCRQKYGTEKCDRVLKITKVKKNEEIALTLKASQSGLGPQVFEVWTCKDKLKELYHFILMEKLDITLRDYFDQIVKIPEVRERTNAMKEILDEFFDMVKRLKSTHIYHNDIHLNNIMIRTLHGGFGIKQMYLIDYGKATSKPITNDPTNKYHHDDATQVRKIFEKIQ